MMSTTEGELDIEVLHEREDGEVRIKFFYAFFLYFVVFFMIIHALFY